MQKLIKALKLENDFLKTPKKQKVFNHVSNGIVPVKGMNYEADLLILPKTKKGFQYLLVVVDLADRSFDIEPLKNKDAQTVLNGFKNMFKRSYVKKPEISLRTDGGGEFQKELDKFLKDNKIIHSVSLPDRHKQMANVESLNRSLGRLFNMYMNSKEIETDEQYNNWDDIISIVRNELNKIRKIQLPKFNDWNIQMFDPIKAGEPKYKIGDLVHRKLDAPKNALNKDQSTKTFREGDIRWDVLPRKIIKVIYMADSPWYRYILDGISQASYCDIELMPSKEKEEKYFIQRFLDFRTNKKVNQVLVKWKGYTVKDATWESIDKIMEDVGIKVYKGLVGQYYENLRTKKTKK
jgi:hydrogenase maturation factor